MKYGLNWDKEKNPETIVEQVNSSSILLKEIKELSIKGNESSHVLIEGDNYASLTLMQETHQKKVDIFIIDPPYNVGGDYLYNDERYDSDDEFRHAKWLNFMEKRMKLAYNLLKDDGVLFCFIGDDELHNLTHLLDQIFGEDNRVNVMSRITSKGSARDKHMENSCDYILVYSKNGSANFGIKREDLEATYSLMLSGQYGPTSNQRYWVKCPDGSYVIPRGNKYPEVGEGNNIKGDIGDRNWYYAKKKFNEELKKGNIVFKELKKSSPEWLNENLEESRWRIQLNTQKKSNIQRIPNFLIDDKFTNKEGTKELLNLFNNDKSLVLMKPKPTAIIKHLIEITNKPNDALIMDFFAGSGTTGAAVIDLNIEDDGTRKSIMCAINDKDSKDKKDICTEVTYERLKRVIANHKKEKGLQFPMFEGFPATLKYLKVEFKEKQGLISDSFIEDENNNLLK